MYLWIYVEDAEHQTYNYLVFTRTVEIANRILQKYFDSINIKTKVTDLEVESYDFPTNPEGEGLVTVLADGR